jgi:hypothetical protein
MPKFYSTVKVLTIPLPPTPQISIASNGQTTQMMASPGTIRFDRGVYDTKALAHLYPEDKQVEFIKKTQYWLTTIFPTPDPVDANAKERSKIVGTNTQTQILANKEHLPINQKKEVPPAPQAKAVVETPAAPSQITPEAGSVKEFPTRNELLTYLVNELKVDSAQLKGKKIPEIIALVKKDHNLDVAVKKAA